MINSRDISRIKLLKGVGTKKAETIIGCLNAASISLPAPSNKNTQSATVKEGGEQEGVEGEEGGDSPTEEELRKVMTVMSLDQLAKFKGVGIKTVEGMRMGVVL